MDDFLAKVFSDQWRVVFVVGFTLLAACELGFRFGLRVFRQKTTGHKEQIGGVQGALFGLLGLLLGFTFAMAVGRYEARRDLVLQEANSIGTTYLRTSFLPVTQRLESQRLLRAYADIRVSFFEAGTDPLKLSAVEHSSTDVQQQLWKQAVEAGNQSPGPLVVSYVNSLNETIDLDATRLAAFRNRIPGAVWLLLLFVAAFGCASSGYAAGTTGTRSAFTNALLPILLAIVMTLIADLSRPHHGLISVTQQPLLDLRDSLK